MSGPRIGVVGPDEAIEPALASTGLERVAVTPGPGAPPDVLVAVGDPALTSMLPTTPAPVLAVGAGAGVGSVTPAELPAALDAVAAGEWTTVRHPVLAATVGDERTHALFDVMLVTAEPARISEYSVHRGGREVARFRADGVVVATPAGSRGYAGAVGGPAVAPETGVVCVVPVAPFAIDADQWVLAADELELRVERDETPIEWLADDRRMGEVDHGETVSLAVVDHLELVSARGLERL